MDMRPSPATDDSPLISIVVCTRNRAEMVPRTMESIFAQNYKPVEIIVLDDGSTDSTPTVMKAYGDRIRYIRLETNRGVAHARTRACQRAQGRYIAFQDDDDLMPPDRLVALRAAIESVPGASFAVGDLELIDAQGQPTGNRWLPNNGSDKCGPRLVEDGYRGVLWPTLPVVPHTTLFRRCDGERIGWFDHQFTHSAEDKDFFARLAQLGPVVYIPKVVSLVRRGHRSLTDDTMRTELGALQLYTKHLGFLGHASPDDADLDERLRQRIAQALSRISRQRALREVEKRYVGLLPLRLRLHYMFRARLWHPLQRTVFGAPSA